MAANTELCVMLDGKLIKFYVSEEATLRAARDPGFLCELVESMAAQDTEQNKENSNPSMNNVAHSGDTADKQFLWPDNAVFLLIDLYPNVRHGVALKKFALVRTSACLPKSL